jgi:hypothetical protein
MDFSNFWWQAAEAPAPPTGIGNSLRFRGAQTLSRIPGTEGNRRTYTFSVWIKKAAASDFYCVFAGERDTQNKTHLQLSDKATIFVRNNNVNVANSATTSLLRDSSAWYHIIYVYDTTQATSNDRLKIFVNGQRQNMTNSVIPSQDYDGGYINASGEEHILGAEGNSSSHFEGYMAQVQFVDSQALEPTEFGAYDANGVWTPKAYTGTYGANGFYLDFSDPADIGADRSGNGNNFTATGFELADDQSDSYDHFVDTPTRNYCLFNPISVGNAITNGDQALGILDLANNRLTVNQVSGFSNQLSHACRGTGKYYYEAEKQGTNNNDDGIGWVVADPNSASLGAIWRDRGAFWLNGSGQPAGTKPNISLDDWIGVELDLDAEVITFYKNGAVAFTQSIAGLANNNWVPAVMTRNGSGDLTGRWSIVTGGKPFNSNGRGQANVPETEHICTANLPAAPILNGRDHFQAITDTGANILTAAQTAFPNGLWWVKDRVNINQHQLVDSVNGTSAVITSPAGSVTAYAAPAGSSVAWCWNAANTDGGFSITDGTHGLGTTPAFVIDRALNVWHQSLPAGQGLVLKSSAGAASQTWTVDGTTASGPGGGPYYSWAEIPGYSSFGSYQGNGNADGPFIYTGFRPAFLILKNINKSDQAEWRMYDSARNTYNPCNLLLQNDLANAEVTTSYVVDFLSNGIKVRGDFQALNGAGDTMIYAAFAENPFGGENIAPATAR